MRSDVTSLSNEEIASRCYEPGTIMTGNPDIRCIARITDDVVVKCGQSVTAEEAANQELAYQCSVAGGTIKVGIYNFKKTNAILQSMKAMMVVRLSMPAILAQTKM